MKELTKFFFIFTIHIFSVKLNDCLKVYKNCNDALSNNEFMDGKYCINLNETVREFIVECKNVDYMNYATYIGTNSEFNTTVKGYEDPFSYVKTIGYSTLNETEMNQFRSLHDDCYQFMFFDNFYSNLPSSKFQFWDGLLLQVDNATDGICRCIVDEFCQQQNSNNLGCNNRNPSVDYNPMITHLGKLSVKPERLPLSKVFIGDTGKSQSEEERFTFAIGKYICNKQYSIIVSTNSPCLKDDILIDNLLDTCHNFKTAQMYIKILTVNPNIQVLGKNSKCLNISLYSAINKNRYKLCSTSDNCTFNCTLSPIREYKLLVEDDETVEVEICEIMNI